MSPPPPIPRTFHPPALDNASRPPPTPDATIIKTAYHLVNFNARENGQHEFCLQAERRADTDSELTLLSITHRDFEQAVLACRSWILDNNVMGVGTRSEGGGERSRTNIRPVALLCESDLSILVYMWALFGLGVPVLLLSIRLSPDALRHLLSEVSAQGIIASPRLQELAAEAVSAWGACESPQPGIHLRESYRYFMDGRAAAASSNDDDVAWPEFASYTGDDDDRNALILHSSGTTTGLPKAIGQSHRYVLNYGQCHDSPDQETAMGRTVSTLPLFHGFGLIAPLLSLTIGKTFVIPPPNAIPSATTITSLLNVSKARSLMTVPSIIEDMHQLPHAEGIDMLRHLDFVGCGGGTLKPSVGSALAAAGVKVVNSYGCTEAGPLSVMYKPGEDHDWRYFKLRSDMGVQVHRSGSSSISPTPQVRLTLKIPSWNEYFELQDYFEQSNDANHGDGIFLRPLERADNVIVLQNGEKVSPYQLESVLSARADVKGALVVGTGHFQLGIIVEPTEQARGLSVEAYRKAIWEAVNEASLATDAHARITSPDAIIVLQGAEGMQRSDKGAILPRDTLKKYEKEIQAMYDRLEGIGQPTTGPSSNNILKGDIEANLAHLLTTVVWRRPSQAATNHMSSGDLFELGMDSLQSMQMRRLIFSGVASSEGLQLAEQLVPRHFVYANPSIPRMAEKLRRRCVVAAQPGCAEARDQCLADYLREFGNLEVHPPIGGQSQQLHLQNTTTPPTTKTFASGGAVVLLTGSTGQLGSHILSTLIANDAVEQIICLNRPSPLAEDPYTRQMECSKRKGAEFSPFAQKDDSRVVIIETQADHHPLLGLPEPAFHSLASQVTHIIHAAWPMDFNRRLSSFASQFKILKDLARLALLKKNMSGRRSSSNESTTVRFLFISSISAVANHPNAAKASATAEAASSFPIPEDEVRSLDDALPLGYAEAKAVCENLVRMYTEKQLIRGSCVRMGQIAGSRRNGYWNAGEHVPTLLKASVEIGWLPELTTTFSWLPVEDAAAAVVDILLHNDNDTNDNNNTTVPTRPVYHVENPTRQPWSTVLDIVASRFELQTKPYPEWLDILRAHCCRADNEVQQQQEKKVVDAQDKDDDDTASSVHALLEFFERVFPAMSDRGVVLSTEYARRASPALGACGAVSEELVGRYLDGWVEDGVLSTGSRIV